MRNPTINGQTTGFRTGLKQHTHTHTDTHDEHDKQGTDQGSMSVPGLVRCGVKTKTCSNTSLCAFLRQGKHDGQQLQPACLGISPSVQRLGSTGNNMPQNYESGQILPAEHSLIKSPRMSDKKQQSSNGLCPPPLPQTPLLTHFRTWLGTREEGSWARKKLLLPMGHVWGSGAGAGGVPNPHFNAAHEPIAQGAGLDQSCNSLLCADGSRIGPLCGAVTSNLSSLCPDHIWLFHRCREEVHIGVQTTRKQPKQHCSAEWASGAVL